MPTFYLDYEGGSDAADGTTFANRWKTITSGATAARIAPGDTIRVMGSPAPTSLGINATWTNKSTTVTLASALNALISNCDSAWTASANVTCTADTTIYRTSTGSAKHAVAAGFTTGKVAYLALGGAQDYSAYQGVTFWFFVSSTTLASGVLTLDLCSDTTGSTPVDTFAIPAISQASQWVGVYVDKGSALGSSIQSISINAISDPGTINLYIDNISTVKAAGDDALNLQSLIGKNTTDETWWGIRGINGTTLTLDVTPSMTVSITARGYAGTTESVTTYKRKTIKTDLVASAAHVQDIQDSGSSGSPITFSGGWNRTDMSTQTLDTWFDGQSGVGYGLHSNSKSYITLEKINFCRYDRCLALFNSSGWTFSGDIHVCNAFNAGMDWTSADVVTADNIYIASTQSPGVVNSTATHVTIAKLEMRSCGQSVTVSAIAPTGGGAWYIAELTARNSNWFGLAGATSNALSVHIGLLTIKDCGQGGWVVANGTLANWWVEEIVSDSNGGSGGVSLTASATFVDLVIGKITSTNNGSYGLVVTGWSGNAIIGELITSGNTSGGVSLSTIAGHLKILKSSLSEATKVFVTSAAGGTFGEISFNDYNGTTDDHRVWYGAGSGGGTILSETSVRHTASGVSWKLSPTSTNVNVLNPMVMKIARLLVNASTQVTLKVWLRRTNTGITGTFRVRGGQIAGVASDVTSSIAAAADTWEEQTLTFTPSVRGIVECEVLVYGGTTYSVYVDDFKPSQA